MLLATGDTHGSIDMAKLNKQNFPEQKRLTKNDHVLIAGDFGHIWYPPGHLNEREQRYYLNDYFPSRKYTTLFIDGNHSNFDLLNTYPDEIWNGGKIHRINDSIIHLKRGQVFEIDGLKVFTMGGAKSIDKAYRKPYISWWPDEEPSNEELEEGISNLEKHNWEVDIVVTHTVSERVLDTLIKTGAMKYPENLNKYFTMLENKLKYKKWFFGHFHTDTVIDDKTIGLYNEIYNVSEDKYLKSFK